MRIGLDLDNTIVCYEQAIRRVANDRLSLPAHISRNKQAIKRYLIECGRESEWTELQGYLYGPYLEYAEPYLGATGCIKALKDAGHSIYIVSHKTIFPIRGERFRLRDFAERWIDAHLARTGCFSETGSVIFCDTLQEKIDTIKGGGFDLFVDDLESVVESLQGIVEPYLFSPDKSTTWKGNQVSSWNELSIRLEVSQ